MKWPRFSLQPRPTRRLVVGSEQVYGPCWLVGFILDLLCGALWVAGALHTTYGQSCLVSPFLSLPLWLWGGLSFTIISISLFRAPASTSKGSALPRHAACSDACSLGGVGGRDNTGQLSLTSLHSLLCAPAHSWTPRPPQGAQSHPITIAAPLLSSMHEPQRVAWAQSSAVHKAAALTVCVSSSLPNPWQKLTARWPHFQPFKVWNVVTISIQANNFPSPRNTPPQTPSSYFLFNCPKYPFSTYHSLQWSYLCVYLWNPPPPLECKAPGETSCPPPTPISRALIKGGRIADAVTMEMNGTGGGATIHSVCQ